MRSGRPHRWAPDCARRGRLRGGGGLAAIAGGRGIPRRCCRVHTAGGWSKCPCGPRLPSMQLTGKRDHREGGVNMRFLAQMMVRRTPRENRVNRPSLRKSW